MRTWEMLHLELAISGHFPECQASPVYLCSSLGLTSPFFPMSSHIIIHLFLQQITIFIDTLGKALC